MAFMAFLPMNKEHISALRGTDENFFNTLVNGIESTKYEAFKKVLKYCEQRLSLAKSKEVERRGGYAFKTDASIPSSFNFGGNA